jgi:cobalamin synthase
VSSGLRVWRGRRVILLPLYGAAIGAMGAGIYFAILHLFLPRSAAALPIKLDELLVATLWGALAFLPRERRRFGIAGAIAIAAGIAIRWLALDALAPGRTIEVFIASQTVPRAAIVAIAWASRPAGEGADRDRRRHRRRAAMRIASRPGDSGRRLCDYSRGPRVLLSL